MDSLLAAVIIGIALVLTIILRTGEFMIRRFLDMGRSWVVTVDGDTMTGTVERRMVKDAFLRNPKTATAGVIQGGGVYSTPKGNLHVIDNYLKRSLRAPTRAELSTTIDKYPKLRALNPEAVFHLLKQNDYSMALKANQERPPWWKDVIPIVAVCSVVALLIVAVVAIIVV